MFIKYYDAAHVQVIADRDILLSINDEFSFMSKGYQFNPKFKEGFWDGRINLFKIRTGLLPRGLLARLIDFLEGAGVDFTVDPRITAETESHTVDVDLFVKSLKLPSHITQIDPSQIKPLRLLVKDRRSLILSPTGSGKSLIAYMACKLALQKLNLSKILLVVPSKQLSEQMYKDFEDYDVEGQWAIKNVHRIYSGQEKDFSKQVTISTYQTLILMPPEHFKQYDFVIVDEAHKAKATSITYILDNCSHAQHRLGMTGTIKSGLTDKMQLEAVIGKITRVATSTELEDRGRRARAVVVGIECSYTAPAKGKLDYNEEIKWLETCDARNRFIANAVAKTPGNNLVLAIHVDHVTELARLIREHGKEVRVITGDVHVDDREDFKLECTADSNITIVGTYGCLSTGINIPELHTGFFATSFQEEVTVMQSVGRIRRMTESKRESGCRIVDFYDSFGKRKTYSRKHFDIRMQSYIDDGIDLKFVGVTLNNV